MTDNKSAPAGYVMVPVELLEHVLIAYEWQLDTANGASNYAGSTGPDDVEDESITKLRRLLAAAPKADVQVYQCPRCATSMEVDPTAKPYKAPKADVQEPVGYVASDGGQMAAFFGKDEKAQFDEFVSLTDPLQSFPVYAAPQPALKAESVQEPVAYVCSDDSWANVQWVVHPEDLPAGTKLYAAPQPSDDAKDAARWSKGDV